MKAQSFTNRPTVVCALEYERRRLVRSSLKKKVDFVCCGPGADNIKEWANSNSQQKQPVILAGLSGSLDEKFPVSSAWLVKDVINADGNNKWTPTFEIEKSISDSELCCTVTSTDHVITDLVEKRALHESCGAHLVDLESVAFAEAATNLGWTWAIIRGVSDDLSNPLPQDIESWVNHFGRASMSRVLTSALRHPTIVPKILNLRTHSESALRTIAEKIRILTDNSADFQIQPIPH